MKTINCQEIIGAGPEWIDEIGQELSEKLNEISCMEIIPENFFDHPERLSFLEKLKKADIPVLIHAVGMSLGTDEPLNLEHLDKVLEIAELVNSLNLSEHLSMTEAGGIDIGQLTPLPWSIEAADVVCRKIEQIQKRTYLPFAIEHVAYRFFYPETELTEPEFINLILKRTGCQLMLDLNNLYCNAMNAAYDPLIWLEQVNLPRVTAIHLAGGYQSPDGTYQDGHNNPVPEAVWDLLDHVLKKITPQSIIVERTSDYPGLEPILSEVSRAEKMLRVSIDEKMKRILSANNQALYVG